MVNKMNIVQISFFDKEGKEYCLTDASIIGNILKSVPLEAPFTIKASQKTLHNKYFYLVERLRRNRAKEYTKAEFPNVIRQSVFIKLKDLTHLYTTGEFEMSTKHLTSEGYSYLIDSLRSFALDTFGYIIE